MTNTQMRVTQPVRLILVASTVVCLAAAGWFGRGWLLGAGSTTHPPTARVPDPVDPAELLDRANQMANRIQEVDWNVDARADALGPGIEPAFAFVRDAIGYDAYAGVLRGSSGAYRARAGNSVDRALLLAQLLARKEVPTQFAFGTLREPERERLFLRIFERPSASGATVPTGTAPLAKSAAFGDRLRQRAKRDYDAVRRALGSRLPPVTKPSREEIISEMTPHVWVQAQVDGQWVDLDPSFPDATPGKTIATVDQTAAEIPEDLFQRLTVRVIAEQLAGDALESSTLLEVTRKSIELIDKQLFVVHTPAGGSNPMGGLGAAMSKALGGSSAWTPAIWLDGEFTFGTSVNVEATAPVFVAEWLEFELTWPGGRREVTRRPLVDRGGAAWRAAKDRAASALRPLDRDDTGPFAMQAAHNVWLSAGRHNLTDFAAAFQELTRNAVLDATGGAVMRLAGSEDPALHSGRAGSSDPADGTTNGGDQAAGFAESMWPFALQNFTWMVWTDHVVIPALDDTPGIRLFADGPRIAVFTTGPTASDRVATVSDLRRDDLRGLVNDQSKAMVLAEKKIRFGLLQGALEHEALAESASATGADPALVETTSRWLSSDGVVVLRPESSTPSELDADARTRLAAAATAGSVVVAPIGGFRHGGVWWEILAGTGDARSTGELGLHPGKYTGLKVGQPIKSYQARGVKAFETEEAARARIAAARRLAYESRNEALIARAKMRYQNSLSMPSDKPAASSAGYTLLLYVGAIIKQAVIAVASQWVIEQLYASVEAFLKSEHPGHLFE